MTYPIFVERYTDKQALTVVCEICHATAVITADGIRSEGDYRCPKGCGGWATYMFQQADDKCGGCGKLGFFSESLNHCCSRACMLQAEYAESLKERAA